MIIQLLTKYPPFYFVSSKISLFILHWVIYSITHDFLTINYDIVDTHEKNKMWIVDELFILEILPNNKQSKRISKLLMTFTNYLHKLFFFLKYKIWNFLIPILIYKCIITKQTILKISNSEIVHGKCIIRCIIGCTFVVVRISSNTTKCVRLHVQRRVIMPNKSNCFLHQDSRS